jgi:hypothetical protein
MRKWRGAGLPCVAAPLAAGATRVENLSPVAIIYLLNAARGPLTDARSGWRWRWPSTGLR